jgi:ankyrin repeat protein
MNIIGMFPTSPLIQAVVQGDPGVVAALIGAGADVNEKDQDGMAALHWAVVAHRVDVLKVLLARGAGVNVLDRFGYTPLHYAATIDFGDADTATALLAAGADSSVKNKEGKTALEQGREYPHILAALQKAGTKT